MNNHYFAAGGSASLRYATAAAGSRLPWRSVVAAWLWTDALGVLSHQTALSLHGLSDILPAQIHLTLPLAWQHRRFRVPEGFLLHHAAVALEERAWVSAVPITSVRRTLSDCAVAGLSPDLLRQAARQAVRRGLVTKRDLPEVDKALKQFGGVKRMIVQSYASPLAFKQAL